MTTPDYDGYSDSAVLANVATLAAAPAEIVDPLDGPGQLRAFSLPEGGTMKLVDVEEHLAKYRAHPVRKTGTFAAHTGQSFADYLSKHGMDETEVWADAIGSQIVGVINAHADSNPGSEADQVAGAAGWGDHRVVYRVLHTEAWKAWIEHNGKLLSQDAFAELIETRLIDIVEPESADMLELAQTFHATVGVRFESSKMLSSGERQLEYREQVDASAGRDGRLDVPKSFVLGLAPFEGADPKAVTARFRYRINSGNLLIGYHLERPEDVLRAAFEDVIAGVDANVSHPVYRGVPSSPR